MEMEAERDAETKREHAAKVKAVVSDLGERWKLDGADTIFLLAKAYGVPFVEAFAARAKEVHAAGGLLRPDGQPRTLGGVFFALVKEELGADTVRALTGGCWGLAKRRRAHKRERMAEKAARAAAADPADPVSAVAQVVEPEPAPAPPAPPAPLAAPPVIRKRPQVVEVAPVAPRAPVRRPGSPTPRP
jgi:hypothetical protein